MDAISCTPHGSILGPKLVINSLRPRPNRSHFADDNFKRIFENENEWISPRNSLKFVPGVRINNIPALVQIMAWRRPGDKPLSETMMVRLPTHICVARPQWVNVLDNNSLMNRSGILRVWTYSHVEYLGIYEIMVCAFYLSIFLLIMYLCAYVYGICV